MQSRLLLADHLLRKHLEVDFHRNEVKAEDFTVEDVHCGCKLCVTGCSSRFNKICVIRIISLLLYQLLRLISGRVICFDLLSLQLFSCRCAL